MGKITGYAAIASVKTDDLLPVVDVHDTSMAATGTTKKMLLSQIATFVASASAAGWVFPSGDTTGATDQAAVTAAEAAAGAGTIDSVKFWSGTFWVTGLTKQAATLWKGSGRFQTVITLATGANADVIQGASFTSLTLGGNVAPGGIGGWGIRDLTIDGNKANQTGTSYGLRFYGYNFDLSNVSIRNCYTDGLYTEWGTYGNPGPDAAMEARYYGLKIHDNNGNGWHNRGPHDSRTFDVTIFDNGAGAGNTYQSYWAESCSTDYPVTSGSNAVDLSTFTSGSPGTLYVSSTIGYPAASISATQGSITVPTAHVPVVLTYTGKTATTFTGCVAQGSPASGSATATGNLVSATGSYGCDGTIHFGMHNYGAAMAWQYMVDATNYFHGCVYEQATTGSALLRGAAISATGMEVYCNTPAGIGIQLGDAANAAYGMTLQGFVNNYANTGASTASLNIANDAGSNSVDLNVYAASGSVVVAGTPNAGSCYHVSAKGGASLAANIAHSLWQEPLTLGASVLEAATFKSVPLGSGSGNEGFGISALASLTSGGSNVAVGDYALSADTSGASNVAVGIYALLATTTGSNNVAVGNSALAANTGGGTSVAVGAYALAGQTSGSSNIAVGAYAQQGTTTGSNNIAIGNAVLANNISSGGNVGVGAYTLGATTGGSNTAVGTYALQSNTTGANNVAVGSSAQASGTAYSYVTAVGAGTQVTASGAVAIGADHAGGGASAAAQDQFTLGTANHQVQILNNTTGSGSAALGANCPAVTATAPYKWFKMMAGDGSTVYVPAWK